MWKFICSELEQVDLQSIASDKLDTSLAPASASPQQKYVVQLLALLFGLGSWFGVTTIFSQMPTIMSFTPEEWMLPFYLSITVQLGNAVALLYLYAHKTIARPFNDAHVICVLMGVGCVAAICLPFTYQITVGNWSIALHIFTFIFAVIGGFSSMLFLPYMKRFRGNYLFIFFLGQALNDVLANGLAAIQGMWGSSECPRLQLEFPEYGRHEGSPLFKPIIAFLLVIPVLVTSTVAFILLNKMEVCRDELADDTEPNEVDPERLCDPIDQNSTAKHKFFDLFMANGLIGLASVSIFPCIHTFTCQQYLIRPLPYNLAIVFIAIYNPLIWFFVNLLPQQSIRIVRKCDARLAIVVPYLLYFAFQFAWGVPSKSLLGLILLVSEGQWPPAIERIHFSILFPTGLGLVGIRWRHHSHENINFRRVLLSKREIDASARKREADWIETRPRLISTVCRFWCAVQCLCFLVVFSVFSVFCVHVSYYTYSIPSCSMFF